MFFRKTKFAKSRSLRLSGASRRRTSIPVETLERRVVFSANPAEEFGSASASQLSHLSPTTCGCPGCSVPSPAAVTATASFPTASAQFPLAETFRLHSLPSATKRIYLDFDGHTTIDALWENGNRIDTPAFSLDANYAQFSDVELQSIQEVWARVAEDFYPFEVDVTTEEPPLDDLRQTGVGDSRWGMRVVIGGSGDWMPDAAGIAVLNSFNLDTDTPCFVFADQAWKANLNFMATAVSHETGHTLGLRHDGHNGNPYYGGRGNGVTSWGPIMGNPAFMSLTQWSQGDYGGSTNREDDLGIITTRNGFGYRPDDHGNDIASATVMAGDPIAGVIERNTDVDVFQFFVAGTIQASIRPIEVGANLDIAAEILDSNGIVVAVSNPNGAIDASFNMNAAPGRYYLRVQGTGEGDPSDVGYTRYGSLGQYTVAVQNVVVEPVVLIGDAEVVEGDAGEVEARFAISLLAAAASPVRVSFATQDGSATIANEDYLPVAGTVEFAPGELAKDVVVKVRGDVWRERDETFRVVISDVVGGVIGDPAGTGVIRNDDERVGVQLLPAAVVETTGSLRAVLEYTVAIKGTNEAPFFLSFETRDGSAVAGRDYRKTSGQIVVWPGQSEKRIAVSVVGDAQWEPDEIVYLAVAASGASNVDVFGPFDEFGERQAASVMPGLILDDDSRFFAIQSVHSTVAAGGAFQFQVGLRRRAGYGEALPSFAQFGSLPSEFLEAMTSQIRFTASFMSGHTPTAGAPRRPKMGTLDVREGTISLGYTANGTGGISTKATDTFEIQTDAVARRRSLAIQLFNPANAMLSGMTVARGTITQSLAAGFASLAAPASASQPRRR